MNVNTEPAERDEDSVSLDGAEVLADWSVGRVCWSSVEVADVEAVSEPEFEVTDASSVGGEVVLV